MHIAVLGVTGGIGDAVTTAAIRGGHTVTALARSPDRVEPREGLRVIRGDVRDPSALAETLRGTDAVLHGVNVPYERWEPEMIELSDLIFAAAEAAGTTVLFPGNLYGLGPDFSEPLSEQSPRHPPAPKKGRLRNELEAKLNALSVPTITLRMGDFFGGIGESTWMHFLTKDALQSAGAIQYPSDPDVLHSWAYLPDAAEAFVRLAEKNTELPTHASFHFEGHIVTGHTWIKAVRTALGDPNRRVKRLPWFWMQFARPFVPLVRELFEMRYLWDQPVRMDGSRLEQTVVLRHTPFEKAIVEALSSS